MTGSGSRSSRNGLTTSVKPPGAGNVAKRRARPTAVPGGNEHVTWSTSAAPATARNSRRAVVALPSRTSSSAMVVSHSEPRGRTRKMASPSDRPRPSIRAAR